MRQQTHVSQNPQGCFCNGFIWGRKVGPIPWTVMLNLYICPSCEIHQNSAVTFREQLSPAFPVLETPSVRLVCGPVCSPVIVGWAHFHRYGCICSCTTKSEPKKSTKNQILLWGLLVFTHLGEMLEYYLQDTYIFLPKKQIYTFLEGLYSMRRKLN